MSKPIPITAARCYMEEGRRVLELDVDGVAWPIFEQKASVLAAGVVPLPPELAEYGETFPVADVANEELATPIENCTSDPVVVELAKRLWVQELEPELPVEIPTREEAEAARWVIDPMAGIFRREIQR